MSNFIMYDIVKKDGANNLLHNEIQYFMQKKFKIELEIPYRL